MRADRLISMLMLVQARGRMTAGQLADELEVTVRTIYRDVDALSAAGVPLVTDRGPGGGISLLDSYRTSLTGLSEPETRALLMLSIPSPLNQLGVSTELASALRKLAASLPAGRQAEEHRVRGRLLVDPAPWHETGQRAPHLRALHEAVWQDRVVVLTRRVAFGAEISRRVDPLALAAKEGVWHLVCRAEGHLRVHRVEEVVDVTETGDDVDRPAEFDLPRFWARWCEAHAAERARYEVRLKVAPDLASELHFHVGDEARSALAAADDPATDGWITLELAFTSLPAARAQCLAFGAAAEVLEPRALRDTVSDFATQTSQLYEDRR